MEDPNSDIEERQWRKLAQLIDENQGALTLEQAAPYLVRSPKPSDESSMLPVLLRFNGRPEVSEAGDIIYTFPDLHETAQADVRLQVSVKDDTRQLERLRQWRLADLRRSNNGQSGCSAPDPMLEPAADGAWLEEFQWQHGDCGWVFGLVCLNFCLAIIVAIWSLSHPPFGLISRCLMANAFAFLAIPAFTSLRLCWANRIATARSAKRKELALIAFSKEMIYDSSKDLLEQAFSCAD
jgi:hypothetical protein